MTQGAFGREVSYRIGSAADLQVAIQGLARHSFLVTLPQTDRMLVATIASELGANIVKYASRGGIRICCAERTDAVDVDIWAEDHGQGIEDIELALTDRYSTGGTLGLGLPGIKRMADEFWIRSKTGEGTLVFARKTFQIAPGMRRRPATAPKLGEFVRTQEGNADRYAYSLAWRPYPGNPFTGDAGCVVTDDYGCLMAMVDASGHGRGASLVAQKVTDVLNGFKGEPLEQLFGKVHEALIGTTGAAMGLAYLDKERNTIRYAATGNTRLVKISGNKSWTGIARDGVLGNRLPTLKLQEDPLVSGDLIVMWTDGIADFEGRKMVEQIGFKTEMAIATALVRELAKPYDDACCLALRWN